MKIKYLLGSIFLGIVLLVGCSNNDEPKRDSNEESKLEDDGNKKTIGDLFGKDDDSENNEDGSTEGSDDNVDIEQNNDEEADEEENEDSADDDSMSNDSIEGDTIFIVSEIDNQYKVEVGDITFTYPNTFSEMASESIVVPIYEIENEDQTVFINVAVEQLPMSMTPEEYISIASSNYGLEYDEVSLKTNGNGIDFAEAITESAGFKINQRIVIIDKTVYVFSYTALYYEENITIFDEITNTIEMR